MSPANVTAFGSRFHAREKGIVHLSHRHLFGRRRVVQEMPRCVLQREPSGEDRERLRCVHDLIRRQARGEIPEPDPFIAEPFDFRLRFGERRSDDAAAPRHALAGREDGINTAKVENVVGAAGADALAEAGP